ncbi:hypothetical protein HPB48_014489 [Haemaphysalis longicornis]|uniref:Thioredoxin domain-containing protein n=1 Tax=Haemaphysalis longicornis TaxID=44386 RepID=A0A9J6GL92_HAELO|nr:hypothetical protein HPB48_014489 [Haemaphysalis longicornis]
MAVNIQAAVAQNLLEASRVIEEQIDAEIEKLDKMADDDLEGLRQKRLDALKKFEKKKRDWLQKGHGEYSELASEPDFFEACKASEHVVIHFYRQSTFRCSIVDKHLAILAQKHVETRFCKISVDKLRNSLGGDYSLRLVVTTQQTGPPHCQYRAPFLCERMKIRVLPTIVLFKDFKSKDFIIGFDDLGGVDDFTTEMMEWRIARSGIINYNGDLTVPPAQAAKERRPMFTVERKTIRGTAGDSSDDDE